MAKKKEQDSSRRKYKLSSKFFEGGERLSFEDIRVVEETVESNAFGKEIIKQRDAETGEVAYYFKLRAFGLTFEARRTRAVGQTEIEAEDLSDEELHEAQVIALSRHLKELDESATETLNYVKEKIGVQGSV